MGRPVKCRTICCQPVARLFKPQCVSLQDLEEIVLGLDEIEAMRLADLEGLYHGDAAMGMGISRQTFGRILAQARKKVARALLGGRALRIASRPADPRERTMSSVPECHAMDPRLR